MTDNEKEEVETAIYWTFGGCAFDEARRSLDVGGKTVDIEQRPLDVLAYLLRHAGEVVTKGELMGAGWPGMVVVDNALTNAVGKLRKSLGADGAAIRTVHRVGYKFIGGVRRKAIPQIAPESQLKAGARVQGRDHWVLVEALSRAERSEVWMAQHSKTGEQRVFKFSLDGTRLSSLKREVTIYRLLKEARGDCEDLVRILDWNFSAAPYYLECEYAGPNLEAWSAQQGGLASIPLSQRIELLAQVAETIGEAHRIGALHKDLKPSNILMALDEGTWRPKVADFGSGRLLDPAQLAKLGVTKLGFTVTQAFDSASDSGTPLYLAPEIINGHQPSTASDVYALGVMLFQLAAGDFKATLAPGWEARVDDDMLRQDIDNAAQTDPDQRIESARVLAERLRSLESRRQAAEREADRQHQQELMRQALDRSRARRPWVVAAISAMAVGVAAVTALYHRAELARADAQQQADIAEQVVIFLNEDVLGQANPYTSGDKQLSIIEAVDSAARRVPVRFQGQPETAARIHHSLGRTRFLRGDYAGAQSEYQAARELFAGVLGSTHRRTLISAMAEVAAKTGQAKTEPEALKAEIESIQRDVNAKHKGDLLLNASLHKLWTTYYGNLLGDAKQAAVHADQAYAMAQRSPEVPEDQLIVYQQNLAVMLSFSDDGERAEELIADGIEKMSRLKGAHHPDTLDFMNFQVMNAIRRGRFLDGIEPARALLAGRREVLGEIDSNTLDAWVNQGVVYLGLGRWEEAATSFESAFPIYEQLHDEDSPDFIRARRSAAIARGFLGQPHAAAAEFDRLIDILQRDPSLYRANRVLEMRYYRAVVLANAGEWNEVEAFLDGLLAKDFGDNAVDAWTPRLAVLHARLAHAQGRCEATQEWLQKTRQSLQTGGAFNALPAIQLEALVPRVPAECGGL